MVMRQPAPQTRPRRSRITNFPPATGGWIANQNLTDPGERAAAGLSQAAYVMDNFFPTASSIQLRRGSVKYATIGNGIDPVRSFLRYKNGSNERLFSATDSAIYDITNVIDPEISPAASVSGTLSGMWSSQQFATTGGVFLVAVNGFDEAQIFDGTSWFEATPTARNAIYLKSITTPFQVGEEVTGSVSGAVATVLQVFSNYIIVGDITEGIDTFANDEPVSGDLGGAAVVDGGVLPIWIPITVNGGTAEGSQDFSYVWAYKNRLFFIQKDTLDAYYMDLDAIGGDVTWFPMGGIFPLGGSLMFGAAWSMDTSGQGGLSEQCIFVSTEGEAAVYQGTDPSQANAWQKVGLYRIGRPLGPNAWIRSGGDIIIATDIGFVPLSQAIRRDLSGLSPVSASYTIENAWNATVTRRPEKNWNAVIWPETRMVIVAPPKVAGLDKEMLIANANTGAWCRFTGWEAHCISVTFGRLFWGHDNGAIIEGNVSGYDLGEPYTAKYLPLFDTMGAAGSLKIASIARATMRSNARPTATINMHVNYLVSWPPAPASSPIIGGSQWGTAVWGTDIWASTLPTGMNIEWVSVSGIGYSMAPGLQITSGNVVPLDTEVIRMELTFNTADIVT